MNNYGKTDPAGITADQAFELAWGALNSQRSDAVEMADLAIRLGQALLSMEEIRRIASR